MVNLHLLKRVHPIAFLVVLGACGDDGTSSNYTESFQLADQTLTSVVIENLAPARWYFSVKASNSAGIESDFSDSVNKLIE